MYLKQNAYNNTEIHHLRLAFEKATGQDLQWFFNQWFLAAGHPELKIIPSYEENRLVLNISQNQDSLYAPIYKIPVLLEVWTEKGCEPRSLQLEKAKETFSLELESKPVFFLFDADNRLPAQVEMQVGVEHWSRQFQFASRAIHRLEALQRLRSDYFEAKETKMAMERALEDSFWAIRQMAVEFLQDAEEEMKKKVLPLVKNLAQKDPQSLVRAQAFKTLGGMAFGAKKEVLELGINDFSIAASGAAFKAYLKEGYSDMDEKIKSLEGENSDLFSPVLAEYFSGRPGEKSWNWFQNALENTSFPDPYNLIQNFAKHLNLLKDSARINAGLQSLFLLAEKRKRPEVQIGVFQVTKSYKSWPGISEKRKRIKAENKNEEVGEILDYLE
jgi:aminopeptidase N